MFTKIKFFTKNTTLKNTGYIFSILTLLSVATVQAEQASVLTTHGDTSTLLKIQPPVPFQEGLSERTHTLTLNEEQQYQSIDGLGFALTEASAKALTELSDSAQNTVLNELFSQENGNAISMVRITIGASDLSSSLYSYNEANTSGDNFSPKTNTAYYIDNPANNLRLGATGDGEQPYTAQNSPNGEDFQWNFVPTGDGHWYIERANGGSLPRLRTDDTNMADMQANDSRGTWEKWQLSVGEGSGRYFLSLPLKGFGNHDRLQVDGDGLVRMADNDQSAGTWESFTFTEVAHGNTDNFSLAGPDQQYLLPILAKIRSINPEIKILATPWTAPRWMKTNNHWIGGELKPEHYTDFAKYFVHYLTDMAAQGFNIWAITVQNEPENDHNEPSMSMNADQQYTFINDHLGPLLKDSPQSQVKIVGFDHNLDNIDFPIQVARSQYVDGSAFHLYAGDISAMSTVKERTGKNVYFTEQYTGLPAAAIEGELITEADLITAFDQDFAWHIENVVIGSLRNWSKTVLEWNLVTSPPTTTSGCVDCMGAITLDENDKSVTRNVSYYIISQLSKDLQAGAIRINSGELSSDLHHVAFVNPDGSFVVLVYNASYLNAADTAINWRKKSLNYSVPTRTAVTFKWYADETTHSSKLEAEDYASMSGIQLEATTDIDGGQNVSWIDSGDWMKYQVNVTATGNYTVTYRVASLLGGNLQLLQNNTSFSPVTVANTGGWQSWKIVEQTIFLEAGHQELTITAPMGGWNINWFELTLNTTLVLDGDNDDVIDSLDDCPNTPADITVDVSGCVRPLTSCQGINVYPNWTTDDWTGGPKTHNEENDLMVFDGNVYSAKWYTNSIPGSDNTWRFVESCN
jgi:O-glycosyl hydrolase